MNFPAERGISVYSKMREPEIVLPLLLILSVIIGSETSKSGGKFRERSSIYCMLPFPLTVMVRFVASLARNLSRLRRAVMVKFPTTPLKSAGALAVGNGLTFNLILFDLMLLKINDQ